MTESYERKRRRNLLRTLDRLGPLTPEEAQAAIQRNNFATPQRLHALALSGLVTLDPTTNSYEITEAGMARLGRGKKNAAHTSTLAAGGPTTSVAGAHPGAGVSIDAQIADLVYEMDGAEALAREVVRGEEDLPAALDTALKQGMLCPDLGSVPRRNRVRVIEEAIAAWGIRIASGPCDFCGVIAPPAKGYAARGYLSSDETGFVKRAIDGEQRTGCSFCMEYLQANENSLVLLREHIGNAVAGTRGVPMAPVVPPGEEYKGAGALRYAYPQFVPLFFEVGGEASLSPWAHIVENPALVGAIQQRADDTDARRIRTVGQRDNAAVPGIVPPIHPPRAKRTIVPPTFIPGSPTLHRNAIRAAEKRHSVEQAEFTHKNPPGHAPGGAPWTAEQKADHRAMLVRQCDELRAIDEEYFPDKPSQRFVAGEGPVLYARRRYI